MMNLRIISVLLLLGLASPAAARAQEKEGRAVSEKDASSKDEKQEEKPAAEFSWIRSESPLRSQKYEKHELTTLPRYVEYGPWFDRVSETVQVDESTTRTTVRVYRQDPQGRRKLEELVEEEQKTGKDGSVRAVRTVSTADVNGKVAIARRETQETVPSGPNAFLTRTQLERPGVSRRLEVVERIEQVETRQSDDTIEIQRSHFLPGPNGDWQVTERIEGSTTETDGIIRTQEKLFRLDGLRKLALSEQQESTEWADKDGTRYRTIETSRPNLRGRLEAVQQVDLIQRQLPEGGQQTVEQVSSRPLGAQSNQLKLVERVIRQTEGTNGQEQTTWVEGLDMTGQLTSVTSFTTVTAEDSSGKKSTRTVSN